MKLFSTKRILRSSLIFMAITLVFTANACYDDYGLTTEDYDVVVTNFDKSREAQFPGNKTYAMPDSVYQLLDPEKDDELDRRYDALMLRTVKENMERNGYQRIENPSETNLPDVIVRVAVTTSTHYGAVWGGYPGWGWGWGWGWYYPWYPSATYYSFETGTVIVDMADTEDWEPGQGEEQIIPALWQGALNGLLQSSTTGTSSRISSGINQMFNQSPYLNVN